MPTTDNIDLSRYPPSVDGLAAGFANPSACRRLSTSATLAGNFIKASFANARLTEAIGLKTWRDLPARPSAIERRFLEERRGQPASDAAVGGWINGRHREAPSALT
jgi:hypothetical protein